jgi:predicted DNA binding CopG/RHH family protein
MSVVENAFGPCSGPKSTISGWTLILTNIFLKRLFLAERRPRNTLEEKMVKKQNKMVLDAYENGKLTPSKSQTDFHSIARNTMKKNRKINIRISENDLSALQRRAAREGIPYQTLIGSVLHTASGFLKEAR